MNRSDIQDALTKANVTAFLRCIRLGEGTSDEAGYYRIVGGGAFTDDSKHPNVRVFLPRWNVYSTAAGAYQIINPTWRGLVNQYGFEDFSPDSQDQAAVALLAGRNALQDVTFGEFESAVQKASKEWASLPGSTAGQRVEDMDKVREVYANYGGSFA